MLIDNLTRVGWAVVIPLLLLFILLSIFNPKRPLIFLYGTSFVHGSILPSFGFHILEQWPSWFYTAIIIILYNIIQSILYNHRELFIKRIQKKLKIKKYVKTFKKRYF